MGLLHLQPGLVHDDLGFMRMGYSLLPVENCASACVGCRKCEPKCSQRISIADWMPRVHAVLGEGAPYPERATAKAGP